LISLSPLTIILAVLPVYLLMMGGALFRKIGVLKAEQDQGIMRLVFSIMLPCFILDKTLGADVLRNGWTLLSGISIGFSLIVLQIAISYFAGKLAGLSKGHGIRTFALASGCQNFGFTAVPVVEILWGSSALALLFVHNIGVEIAVWSVGVMLLSGEADIQWKRLINGPIVAVCIALLLASIGLDRAINGPIREAISMIGAGAFPVAILMTGASIMDLAGRERPCWKTMIVSCLVRLLICPALILLCARWVPMATELQQILVVQAAMPAALVPILLARLYGGRPAVAVQVVVATTLVSLLTLPYIITFGIRLLHLTPLTP
jgi:predicted permease